MSQPLAPDLQIDGQSLTLQDVADVSTVSHGGLLARRVTLSAGARRRLADVRRTIEDQLRDDAAPPVYGFNTGVGSLKSVRISRHDVIEFQAALIAAHAAGSGEPFDDSVVRATMLLRANALAVGVSAARPALVDRLLDLLNAGIHPVIPQRGSVGASGDLAPLAYLAAAVVGVPHSLVRYQGRELRAPDALVAAGLDPGFTLEAKDAVALLNGSTVSLAVLALALHAGWRVARHADVALALTMEAMRAETAAFDPRVHQARPHQGQIESAAAVRRLLAGSARCTETARSVRLPADPIWPPDAPPVARIHDVYSLRCGPQIHGAARDALRYIQGIVDVELNAATDNPLVFKSADGETYEAISGGNFHGQYLAQAADVLALALTDLTSVSERRSARLIDPLMSYGLPANLATGTRGVNTGYAAVSCAMSALVMENRTLSAPGSVDSIPGKGNVEDHVSNSTWCARKAAQVAVNARQVIATELLLAAQAVDLSAESLNDARLGKGTSVAYAVFRKHVSAALSGDRWWHDDLRTATELVQRNDLLIALGSDAP